MLLVASEPILDDGFLTLGPSRVASYFSARGGYCQQRQGNRRMRVKQSISDTVDAPKMPSTSFFLRRPSVLLVNVRRTPSR
jgi:hypothetical protein